MVHFYSKIVLVHYYFESLKLNRQYSTSQKQQRQRHIFFSPVVVPNPTIRVIITIGLLLFYTTLSSTKT